MTADHLEGVPDQWGRQWGLSGLNYQAATNVAIMNAFGLEVL